MRAIEHVPLFYNIKAANLTLDNLWFSTFWNFEPDLKHAILDSLLLSSMYNPVLWMMPIISLGSYWVFGMLYIFNINLDKRLKSIIYILLTLGMLRIIGIHFLAIIIGLILAYLTASKLQYIQKLDNCIIILVLLSIGLFFGSYPSCSYIDINNTIYRHVSYINTYTSYIHEHYIFYHIFGASLIIFALITSRNLRLILSKPPLIFLGKISFSMYIIHLIIIGSLSSYLFITLYQNFLFNIATVITALITIPLIIISAHYMQKYIDNGGMKISWKIYNMIMNLVCEFRSFWNSRSI